MSEVVLLSGSQKEMAELWFEFSGCGDMTSVPRERVAGPMIDCEPGVELAIHADVMRKMRDQAKEAVILITRLLGH